MGQARRKYTKRADWWADKGYLKGNLARPKGSPSRRAAGRAVSNSWLAWCPPELREEYRFLTQRKGLLKAEAKAMLEEAHPETFAGWRA